MTDDFARGIDDETFIRNAFRVLLQREPSTSEFEDLRWGLYQGATRASVIASLTGSQEFSDKLVRLVPEPKPLPSLIAKFPQRYRRAGWRQVFDVRGPEDFDFLERCIVEEGYYERAGEWAFEIGFDHRVLATMISLLGPRKVLEVGCGFGGVLSSLTHLGVDCTGLDASEFAKRRASRDVEDRIILGDLLTADLTDEHPDLICGFDIFEHFNPNKIDAYFRRCADLLPEGGMLLINMPVYGEDDMFGTLYNFVLREWTTLQDQDFFTSIPCDEKGWPVLGHLIWASPRWWEQKLASHGLVRQRMIERALHSKFDDKLHNTRRSFFLCVKAPSDERVRSLADGVASAEITHANIEACYLSQA